MPRRLLGPRRVRRRHGRCRCDAGVGGAACDTTVEPTSLGGADAVHARSKSAVDVDVSLEGATAPPEYAYAISTDEETLPSSALSLTAASSSALRLSVAAPAVLENKCVGVALAVSEDGLEFATRVVSVWLLSPDAEEPSTEAQPCGLDPAHTIPPAEWGTHTEVGESAAHGAAALGVGIAAAALAGVVVVVGAFVVLRRRRARAVLSATSGRCSASATVRARRRSAGDTWRRRARRRDAVTVEFGHCVAILRDAVDGHRAEGGAAVM